MAFEGKTLAQLQDLHRRISGTLSKNIADRDLLDKAIIKVVEAKSDIKQQVKGLADVSGDNIWWEGQTKRDYEGNLDHVLKAGYDTYSGNLDEIEIELEEKRKLIDAQITQAEADIRMINYQILTEDYLKK